ncbi:Beta-mannosidase [Rubellimicrobium mesophilum DSM 19309]|uniref:beta-mannosidase n=1 Tax=Rubellimicrobium mesophilum DSM 19309 TaxID=442562 RepID=A0A017HJV9_9RHOB|nr:glycoside hydrolase family 2 protein [Rubellimicrobium mesophilum]EYD74600.1 Beta-mannosidase [Rubellimicrobium mesophilum DSM 19309]
MNTPISAIQDLAGPWSLTDATGEHSCLMRVPGDGITALHEAHQIPEPYWGRNEVRLRWIAERDWTIRRQFDLADPEVVLVIDGLDTVATVRVNGTEVLRAANAFRTWRVDLSGVARRGANTVEIAFHSAPKEAARLAAEQPFPVPYIHQNNPIPHGNMLRKVACDWGWDWNIALCPFGITGGIWLEEADAPRIERLAVAQEHEDGRVALTVTAWAENAEGAPFRITFAGQAAEGVLEDGGVSVIFDVENPQLWWPAGLGPQTLYDLEVRIGDDVARRRIGLRKMELVSEPDAAGRSFGIRVNGRPVFARGANWIPTDALSGRITEEATRDLLQSAAGAHMNMIRVWGGGRYEPDSFYDACDELGLMVWQDFMFSCNLYSSTPGFLAEVDAEVRENVARMHHHACLALWCGDNELIGALTWFPESRNDRDRYLASYDRLNRTIETALRETDPAANWWPSSPSAGPLDFRDAWHVDGTGDMHFWSVWHEGKPFDHYRDVSPRFCSEFGFQSYPSMDVIRTFAGPEDWNIASPVLESHQRNASQDGGPDGNARIAATMFRYFRWPERFEDFVWLSQVQQGMAIKTAVTHWRSLKPHCQGTLYWQLNDTWPVCSWSSLDYGGGWKVLHHMARDFFRPVLVTAVPGPEGIALVGVNDTLAPVEITVTAYATALNGAAREIGRGQGTVGEGAERLLLVAPDALGEQEVLTFGWEASDGSRAGDVFAPRPWKAYDLPDPQLAHQVTRDGDRWVLSVNARAMAFFVTAEADLPGRWDRNAIHLGPGRTARLTFTPQSPGREPRFALRDLHSATTGRQDQRTA